MIASPGRPSEDAGLVSLTYVSACRISEADVDREVADILVQARAFNAAAKITGALMFTGRRFAQTLEGEADVVDALTRDIAADKRHAQLLVIDRHEIRQRQFSGWSMAYAGPSVFVSRSLERALMPSHPNYAGATTRLLRLIAEFARQSALPHAT